MEIYCKNQKGIKDMYRLISKASTVDLNNSPRVYSENIKDNRANLIITNSPTESDV
jgi:DNA polymerase III alpha subunit (gram-positive type)